MKNSSLVEMIKTEQECYFGVGLVFGNNLVSALLGYDKMKEIVPEEHSKDIFAGMGEVCDFNKTGKLPERCLKCGKADSGKCNYVSIKYEINEEKFNIGDLFI